MLSKQDHTYIYLNNGHRFKLLKETNENRFHNITHSTYLTVNDLFLVVKASVLWRKWYKSDDYNLL